MSAVRDFSDDQIVAAVRSGARIHTIAARLGLGANTRASLRKRLQHLERAGRLRRPARLQYENSYFWQVAP